MSQAGARKTEIPAPVRLAVRLLWASLSAGVVADVLTMAASFLPVGAVAHGGGGGHLDLSFGISDLLDIVVTFAIPILIREITRGRVTAMLIYAAAFAFSVPATVQTVAAALRSARPLALIPASGEVVADLLTVAALVLLFTDWARR